MDIKDIMDKAVKVAKESDLSTPTIEIRPLSKTLTERSKSRVKASIGFTGNVVKKALGFVFRIEW